MTGVLSVFPTAQPAVELSSPQTQAQPVKPPASSRSAGGRRTLAQGMFQKHSWASAWASGWCRSAGWARVPPPLLGTREGLGPWTAVWSLGSLRRVPPTLRAAALMLCGPSPATPSPCGTGQDTGTRGHPGHAGLPSDWEHTSTANTNTHEKQLCHHPRAGVRGMGMVPTARQEAHL